MNIISKKFFAIVFSLVVISTMICGVALAADSVPIVPDNTVTRIYDLSATYNGEAVPEDQEFTFKHTYIVDGEELIRDVKYKGHTYKIENSKEGNGTIRFTVNPKYIDDTLQMGYRWDAEDINVENGVSAVEFKVPYFTKSGLHVVLLESIINNVEKEYVGNSNTMAIVFDVKGDGADFDLEKDGKKIEPEVETPVKSGDEVVITTENPDEIVKYTYWWENYPKDTEKHEIKDPKNAKIKIPGDFERGKTYKLHVTAELKDGTLLKEKIYIFKIPMDSDFDVEKDGKKIEPNKEADAKPGDELTITSPHPEDFVKYTYRWDGYPKDTEPHDLTDPKNAKIKIPDDFEPGKTYKLIVTGTLKDGTVTSEKIYIFKISLKGEIEVKLNDKVIEPSKENKAEGGDKVNLEGKPSTNFSKIIYNWDKGADQELLGGSGSTKVPSDGKDKHILYVSGVLTDGSKTPVKEYIFVLRDGSDMDIEPWMEKNDDAEGLLISLRNDSENEDKANKNFYALNEEVTYYIDYLNAGKKIDGEVKIVFETPLEFEEISTDGGTVDKSGKKPTITWTFPDGLDKDACGTKVVKLKYTALSKKSYTSEMIYPNAKIFKGTKVQDTSAVINCIYKYEDTELEDSHKPYMFGDRDKPTFRPDDGISRAEGALVLMRIFNVDYSNTVVTTKFSDITDTYLEARKAIIEASKLGVINGYEDGTYRPNDKMTRAEFMKIIASYIEVKAKEDDIDGLEVKNEEALKLYKNPSSSNKWALSYVTLLTRLNMTSVSSKNKDLKLADNITRAEVAQLVNFYSFRAPYKLTASTKMQFDDVTRSHKLIGDILEATREAHSVYVNDEGKEVGK